MTALIAVAAGWTVVLILGAWAAMVAAVIHLSKSGLKSSAPLLPMTLIKPIRGLDDAMERSFDSILAADPQGRLQLIVALESEADPAFPLVEGLRKRHAQRDIQIVLAGPSQGRMGKIHNMIAALPHAKHPRMIFSDADSCVTAALLQETSEAFADGCAGVFAIPYHPQAPGLGGQFFQIAMNHSFSAATILAYDLGQLRFCAGAWMAYTKDALERAGGLEPFAQCIADDFAISNRVAALGLKRRLLHEPIIVEETGSGVGETFRHIAKWLAIIRSCLPGAYAAVPLFLACVWAAACWGLCEFSGQSVMLGRWLLAAALATRVLTSILLDVLQTRPRLSALGYLAVTFIDFGAIAFWLTGFRSTILWRGTRYRLSRGGHCEVLSSESRHG